MSDSTDQNSNSVCIHITGLDSQRIKYWLDRADASQEADPVTAFFSAWVSFNYYYCTFAFLPECKLKFDLWADRKWPGGGNNKRRKGDRSQWKFLVNNALFQKVYSGCKVAQPDLFELTVKLPIEDMANRRNKIPPNKNGMCKVSDLSIDQVFDVLYQIRNNLFHGQKYPDKNKRDLELTTFGVKFLAPFMRELLKRTDS